MQMRELVLTAAAVACLFRLWRAITTKHQKQRVKAAQLGLDVERAAVLERRLRADLARAKQAEALSRMRLVTVLQTHRQSTLTARPATLRDLRARAKAVS